ncbi:MAG TPA: glycoside hydrolase domain-containing protein, partial [Candidatus Kapabacteria bacterium]|nr:glycoside hydrolase domain-containing protein [Candidatus Kapabacteria bacterium]
MRQSLCILTIIFILLFLNGLYAVDTAPGNTCETHEIPYTTGNWDAASLGNHRVMIHVADKTDAIALHIPWRRRDLEPEKKNVIIVDAQTGQRIDNVFRVD